MDLGDFEAVATPRERRSVTSSSSNESLPFVVALEEPREHKNILHAAKDTSITLWNDLRRRVLHATSAGDNSPLSTAKLCSPSMWSQKSRAYFVNSVQYYTSNLPALQREVLCGIAVMLLQAPETIAFSYVAGVDPVVGLYATAFLGIIVGAFGGTAGIVAGAAGALAVVMPPITSGTGALKDRPFDERMQHLFMAVFFTGVFQLVFGLLGFTRFLSMVPKTAMIGFLNGLALVMFVAQLPTFQQCPASAPTDFHTCMRDGTLEWMAPSDPSTWTTVFVVVLTMLIMHYFPKIPRVGHLVPPTLVVAVVCVALEFGVHRPLFHAPTRTIGDISPLSGSSFPPPRWPSLGSAPNWTVILTTSGSLAIVGIFESLLTLQVVCELTQRSVTNAMCRQETLAQGVGNVVCGLFGAMGGASMIGQSTGSVLNGARGRLSAVVGGFVMLAVVLGAGPVVEAVPVACLTGVMFIICSHTFYWPTFRLLLRLQLVDVVGIVLVTALAAAINLAVAVIAGIVWHALVHAWQHSHLLTCTRTTERLADGTPVTVYAFEGTFLFSSATAFRDAFAAIHDDPATVVVDFERCLIVDFSAVAAVRQVALRYRQLGKKMVVRHLNDESKREFTNDLPWAHTHVTTATPSRDADNGAPVDAVDAQYDHDRATRCTV